MRNKNLIKLATELSLFNKDFKDGKCRIIDEKVYNNSFLYFYFFYWSSQFYENPYRPLLVDFFDKAEKAYPGSSHMLSVKLCNLIYGNIQKHQKVKTEKNYDIIMKYLSQISNQKSFDLFSKVLEFSGADATITCEKTKNSNIEVSKVCFPKFDFLLDKSFSGIYFSNVSKTTKNFIVSVVDGFIERESELYSLVEYAKINKLPAILICRGMSDYARQNLKQIILRNNVYIYPYIEKYNNDDPFKVRDFASLLETEIVSSEYSDNMNVDLVEKTRILKCIVSNNSITLFNKSKSLVDEINKQIESNKGNTELLEYLKKRKIRCSPNNTIVKIPESDITLLNEFKNLIKCYNYCAIKGVYTNSENRLQSIQSENITTKLSENLYKVLKNISYKIKLGDK